MNERIRELAEQTDIWCDQNWHNQSTYDLAWEDKFAELIVLECLQLCKKQFVGAVGTHASAHNRAVMYCRDGIKEHFGVKDES